MMRTLTITLLTALLPLAAIAAEPPPAPSDWRTNVEAGNPLVGTLWNVAAGRQAAPPELARAGAAADFVLLGEKHDNPDHHRLQAWMIRTLVAQGRRSAVALEMLDADQADALQRHLAEHPRDAAGLGKAVGWRDRGWPDWDIYRPLAAAALKAGLPLRTADVARPTQRKVAREGLNALPDEQVRRLGLDRPLAAALRANLRQELIESHCNMLPEKAIAPMAKVQRLRDAFMADSLIDARESADQAVLIAGNGHIRADRGVPWYLRARLERPAVLTVAILEVRAGEQDWRSYLPKRRAGTMRAFDYVWFTPRVDNEDPCVKFADQLREHGESTAPAD